MVALNELVSILRKRRCKPQRTVAFLRSPWHHLQKSLRAEERKLADVARARRRWIREQAWLDTTRLVFIDETAITADMVLLDGWNPRGERLVAEVKLASWLRWSSRGP